MTRSHGAGTSSSPMLLGIERNSYNNNNIKRWSGQDRHRSDRPSRANHDRTRTSTGLIDCLPCQATVPISEGME